MKKNSQSFSFVVAFLLQFESIEKKENAVAEKRLNFPMKNIG